VSLSTTKKGAKTIRPASHRRAWGKLEPMDRHGVAEGVNSRAILKFFLKALADQRDTLVSGLAGDRIIVCDEFVDHF